MNEKLIYKVIVGSQAYGTNIETSDIDYKGIYMQSIDDLITFKYTEQINVTKDETYYEIRRFIQLLRTANPTVLEMLFTSDEFVVEKHPVMDIILKHKHRFLTKKCLESFGGYAIAQIKKANGLDKKINWENEKTIRKTPIDFMFFQENGQTITLTSYLEKYFLKQENCGLSVLNHFRDGYSLFYDETGTLGYRGLIVENSTSLRLSSIPKGETCLGILYYNKDGYSTHCKDYNSYTTWLDNRNTQRYVDVKNHNQKIDGKNLLHCRRLLDTAIEIAELGTINVFRPNREYLIKIRKGDLNLPEIIKQAEKDIAGMKELYAKSNLPDDVDDEFINELLLEMRRFLKL